MSMVIKELSKKYVGKAVVDSISVKIPESKFLSLIGSSGAGESTVMGIVSKFIQRDGGVLNLNGHT